MDDGPKPDTIAGLIHRAMRVRRRQAEQDRRLDEILRELGELREERRRWPGLRAALVRFWRGESGE